MKKNHLKMLTVQIRMVEVLLNREEKYYYLNCLIHRYLIKKTLVDIADK